MSHRSASSDIVARGFCYDEVSLELGQKYMNGSMTAADLIQDIQRNWGSVGIWWGSIGMTDDDFYGSAEDARDYAGWAGDGSVEHRWEDMLDLSDGEVNPAEWMDAEIRVVLVAKKPMRDYGLWNPTTENGEGGAWESTSFFNEGERLELVEVHYAADRSGNDWKVERASGLSVTAAADLPPGLRMENPKPNQVVAYDDGNPSDWHARFGIGVLSWDNDGVISWVGIQGEEYQRRGIATAMLEYARTIRPDIKHSDELSESGAGWAQAVGSRTAAAGEFKVMLRGPDNDIDLSTEPDVDAPTMFFFDRLMDTIKFVKEQQGRDLWYFSFDDDRGFVPTRLDSVKVYQQGQDKSDEFRQFIGSHTAYVSDDIIESYYQTDRLVSLVMNANVWGEDDPLWTLVAGSYEEAEAFFNSLDEDERRLNVAEVLENGGWSLSAIGRKFSNRTAAEPGGVLPWTPSSNGYYWITLSDGTLEAVTNDGVNRMYLTDEGYGWVWEVHDDIGKVESGNFGTSPAMKSGDALRDRANDLLSEFDTAAQKRTRGPSRGYQDDYTQAPNTLWSKREALHHEEGNSSGVAIVLTIPMEYRESLAMPDGTPAEELHITLGYFGNRDELAFDLEGILAEACQWTASYLDPFIVSLGGLIRFSGEDQDAFVLNADAPEIDSVRSVLLGWLDATDSRPDDTHGFTPHMTLGYLDHDESLPFDRWEPVEVPVTAIELWWGDDEPWVFPLGITPAPALEARRTTSQRYAERMFLEGRS